MGIRTEGHPRGGGIYSLQRKDWGVYNCTALYCTYTSISICSYLILPSLPSPSPLPQPCHHPSIHPPRGPLHSRRLPLPLYRPPTPSPTTMPPPPAPAATATQTLRAALLSFLQPTARRPKERVKKVASPFFLSFTLTGWATSFVCPSLAL